MKTLIFLFTILLCVACGKKNKTGRGPVDVYTPTINQLQAGTSWETAPATTLRFSELHRRDRHHESAYFRAPQDGVLQLRLQKSGKGFGCARTRGVRAADFVVTYKFSQKTSEGREIQPVEVRGAAPFTYMLRQNEILTVNLTLAPLSECDGANVEIFAHF